MQVSLLEKIMYFLLLFLTLSILTSKAGINIAVIASNLVFILIILKQPFYIKTNSAIGKAICTFFFVSTMLCLFSKNVSNSLVGVGYWMFAFLPFYTTLYTMKKRDFTDWLPILITLSTIVGSAVTIWQGLHGNHRAPGFLGIMDLAGILGLVIPFLLIQFFEVVEKSQFKKWILGISLLMAFFALIYNGTRGVWVSTAFTTGIYIAFSIRKNKQLRSMALIFLIIIILFLAINPNTFQRISTIVDTRNDLSNAQRITMWIYAWSNFLEHPIIGVGWRTLHFNIDNNVLTPINDFSGNNHVHNNLLQFLAEGGIIGLVAFLGLFATILNTAWRRINEAESRRWGWVALLCTLHLLIHGLFDYTFDGSRELFVYWFFMGVAFSNLETASLKPVCLLQNLRLGNRSYTQRK